MIVQSMAAHSMSMAGEKLQGDVGAMVTSKALENMETQGEGLLELIDEVAEIYEHLGNHVNTKA